MEKTWKISEKREKDQYMKKAFSFWKTSFLPTNIQLLNLKMVNNNYKLNNQLKHFLKDENDQLISGKCTFCTIKNTAIHTEESIKHLFLECESSIAALRPVADKYSIPIPNLQTDGELLLYFYPKQGKWDELRINTFYMLYKYHIHLCRVRKQLPTATNFEFTLKNETKKIVMTNPTNNDLVENLLPLWTGHELTEDETVELLEECEGDNFKGRIFMNSNKKTVILNTKVHQGFGFPIGKGNFKYNRLNDLKNHEKMTSKLFTTAPQQRQDLRPP